MSSWIVFLGIFYFLSPLEAYPLDTADIQCLAQCADVSVYFVNILQKACGHDRSCYIREGGESGAKLLRCTEKCPDTSKSTKLEFKSENSDIIKEFQAQDNTPEFLKCMGECLKKDVSELIEIYNECHKDIKCWLKKLGIEGLKCAGECLKAEEELLIIGGIVDKAEEAVNNDFLKCMAHCLKKDVAKLLPIFNECKTDPKCWLKKVGIEGLKCATKCIRVDLEEEQQILTKEDVSDNVSDSENDNFLKCMAKCMGKDVKDIYKKCHKDKKCWAKKLGIKGMKCAVKCAILETSLTVVRTEPVNNDFLKCMGHCLRKDVKELIKIYEECHTDAHCWAKKVGIEGLKCAAECLAIENAVQSYDETIEIYSLDGGKWGFLKCMGKCMKTHVSDIPRVFLKCVFSATCWLAELGIDAYNCAKQCYHKENLQGKEVFDIKLTITQEKK